jgi:hypothetical protein
VIGAGGGKGGKGREREGGKKECIEPGPCLKANVLEAIGVAEEGAFVGAVVGELVAANERHVVVLVAE